MPAFAKLAREDILTNAFSMIQISVLTLQKDMALTSMKFFWTFGICLIVDTLGCVNLFY